MRHAYCDASKIARNNDDRKQVISDQTIITSGYG